MFCHQCQEAAKNTGCTLKGVCGKSGETSDLQDLLIYFLQGIAVIAKKPGVTILPDQKKFIIEALFATITNANFDETRFYELIEKALKQRDYLLNQLGKEVISSLPDNCVWTGNKQEFPEKAKKSGIVALSENEDIRSLKSLLLFGMKGIAAYAHHAEVLGYEDPEISSFLLEGLSLLPRNTDVDEAIGMVLKAGEVAVKTMALLDTANTKTYGNPEITQVSIGVRNNPGILISGHDLKDLEELLEQTENSGVDVYTHSEMLPANYYPAFKKYRHFAGNYGNAWWKQNEEFESFNGPILLTTNCIIPVKESYKNRLFSTGVVGYSGVKHIPDRVKGGKKDFAQIIEMAKKCPPPTEIESGEIVGGFAHDQVMKLADKVVDAVKSGAIKRFIVMAGCDGRHKTRSYFTEVAETLPKDTVILTAGCAKYRYNKLNLGDIGGIPRVLDAGQCNDSYSLALVALKLKEVFGLDDINQLPLSFDIAWYEQKAVTVLLALLFLGVKGIRLGPTLPAFLSPNVVKVLVEKFDIKPIDNVNDDVEAMMQGK